MENMEVVIRRGEHDDLPTLVAFQLEMARETEGLELDKETVFKGVSHILAHPETGNYFVATLNSNVVASMLTLYEWSDWRNGNVVWIHSLYVVPEHRGKKIFSAMYAKLKSEVENNFTLRGIRLYVDKTNQNAIEVYTKLGMNQDHYAMFEWMKT